MEEFVALQKELLKEEHQAEINECLTLHKSLPLSELQNRGVCLKKLHILSLKTGLYGRTVAKLGLRGSHGLSLPSNSFSSGDIVDVHLKTATNLAKPEIQGVVVSTKDASISIAIDGEGSQAQADELYSNDVILTLIKGTNEVTYKRLQKCLDRVFHHRGPASGLLEICFGNAKPSSYGSAANVEYYNEQLNSSQKDAVMFSLTQRDLAIIHGPPGTGKTTTIAEVITQFVSNKQKVLACAPSNVAIDNILEKLSNITMGKSRKRSGIRLVRIGHPARILIPELQKLSLDAIIAKSESAKIVQDVRKDIDNLHLRFRRRHNKAERAKLREEKQILSKELREREKKAISEVLSSADVVLATNIGAHHEGPLKYLPTDHFNVVVIDECAQALEASCWIPILQAPKLILAGDHLQLPPTVKSRSAGEKGLSTTLLERMTERHKDAVKMLDTQYRMNSSIMNWSSNELYGSKLKPHSSVKDHTLHQLPNVLETENTVLPLLLVDTAGCNMPELQTSDNESIGNEGEANIVAQHVESLIQAGVSSCDIAVISPYNMQVDILRKLLREKYSKLEIRSVDGFQGREKEAVVISMVRSNTKGIVGFLSDNRRMNVAVTRARRHLAIVCDSDTVGRHKFLKSLLDYISKHGEVRSGYEYEHELEHVVDASKFKIPLKEKNNLLKRQHDLNDAKSKYRKIIQDFMTQAGAGGPKSLKFSAMLFGYERLAVHEICEELGIYHRSTGEGKDRRIVIAMDDAYITEKSIAVVGHDSIGNQKISRNDVIDCVAETPKPSVSSNDQPTSCEIMPSNLEKLFTSSIDISETVVPVESASKTNTNIQTEMLQKPANCIICELCGRELPVTNSNLHKIHCAKLQAMKQKFQEKPVGKSVHQKKKMPGKPRRREKIHSYQSKACTDEELLENAIQANKSCFILGCDKSVSMLGRTCPYCKRLFCLEHHMPELHGCGDAARVAARRQISRDMSLHAGGATSSNKKLKHAILQRKLDHKLKEMEDKRKATSKKKS